MMPENTTPRKMNQADHRACMNRCFRPGYISLNDSTFVES